MRLQVARFRRFLTWLLVPFVLFGPYDLSLFFIFDDLSSGLLGLLILSLIPTLWYARRVLDRGRLDLSVTITIVSLLVPATLIVFLRPYLYPVLVVGCLLAVAVALPFVARKTLRRLVYAGIANAALIIILGNVVRPMRDTSLPPEFRNATVGASLLVVTSLVFLMIWLFSSRLTESLDTNRRAQATLAQANERLLELDRAKTQFMNMTAHEFSTPLTPIRIQLHLLRTAESQNLSEVQRSSLKMIERNFSRLSQLAADLLDMTRVQAGKLRLDPHPVRLASLAADAIHAQQGVADAAGIRVSAQLDDTLMVAADARRMAQVMDNLLANALKFTPRGGQIHATLECQDGQAVFSLRDNGVGLEPADMKKLFIAFSQIGARHQGTGLGLFISRGIIEAHGGRIWAESGGRDQGATFAFALPLTVTVRAVPVSPSPQAVALRRA
jgi:signal transduction histidine kinase